ncbi:MAG TPA: transketolase C-terminal domain-containing protein [Prolixibacteraceae bacterium]|nr:transketolase C-terminal domain-containing protein [Prolixibacteraceae bacterium]
MNIKDKLIKGKANLEIYSETLIELGLADKNVMAVTSDSRGSGKLVPFAEKLPDQIVEIGIAEQNLVGVAAGLASTGKKVFATSPGCFLATRSLEQVKNDVAYSNYPVNLVGISSGVSYGALGSTHHSIHDVAVLRAIHNMIVIVPADNFETREAVKAAAALNKPVYLKFGKKNMPHLHSDDEVFEIGKALTIVDGPDVAFIACGETVAPAFEAARQLHEKGISARVISMHTIKPLDTETVLKAAKECKAVIAVEEHSINGGLGEACASTILEAGISVPFKRVGILDEETVAGSQAEIFQHYGISAEGLYKLALNLINHS